MSFDRGYLHSGAYVNPAALFGLVFDIMLFGILTVQVYIYFISFPNDRALPKIAVVWVYLVGATQTGLVLFDITTLLVAHVIDYTDGLQKDHLWLSITAFTGVVAIVIQSLYAHRIYMISQKRWLAILVICMSVVQFGSSMLGTFCFSNEMVISLVVSTQPAFSKSPTCNIGFTLLWGPVNIACDSTITICMVTFLLRCSKTTMRYRTRSHIRRTVQIVIETGMATTALMITYTAFFILWTQFPAYIYFPLPGLLMSKVYSNSMLVLLNNRATIVHGRNSAESLEFVEVPAPYVGGGIELETIILSSGSGYSGN